MRSRLLQTFFLEAKQNESQPHLLLVLSGGDTQTCHPPTRPLRKDLLAQLLEVQLAVGPVKDHLVFRAASPKVTLP